MALPDAGDVARMRRIIARLVSYGVEVREMPGHEKRGFKFPVVPSRVVDHHDASSRKSGEWGALGLCLDGTPRGIPGPLCNVLVARCLDGKPRLAIVADGYAYHAGVGGPYAELPKNDANPRTYGVEKANDGLGEPYTAAANYATNALFQAMAVESGAIPESFPIGHKEWAPGRKSDPLYSMADRRRQVGTFAPSSSSPNGDFMPALSDAEQREILAAARELNAVRTLPRAGVPAGVGKIGEILVGLDVALNSVIDVNKAPTGANISVRDHIVAARAEGRKQAPAPDAAPAAVDASAVAAALAANIGFIDSLAKAVNDDAARRMAS